jgi:hypothetical protein
MERLNEIASNRNYYDKKKTYKNQIHNRPSPDAGDKHRSRCNGALPLRLRQD